VKNTAHVTASLEKKSEQTIDQSELSIFRNLLHRLEQVAIQICVAQLVAQLSNSPWQTCNKSPAARLCNKRLRVSSA